MLRKSLAWLLTLLMVISIFPVSVFATEDTGNTGIEIIDSSIEEPTGDANVNDVSGETEPVDDNIDTEAELRAALEAGGKVVLGGNIEVTDTLTIPAGKTVTLDLNGKTISQTKAQTAGYQMILNDGNLTITDSVGGGMISYTDSGNGGNYISDTIYNRGTLVIKGGTIENLSSETVAANGYPHAVDTYSGIRDTSVTINGGTIYCKEYSAIRMFCVSATYEADLVINEGATIKGAIDMQNGTSAAALGTLTINGGTFITTKNANNIRFANWNGGATTYGITAEIKGGTFNGGISTQYVPAAANWNSKIITGGKFTSDVSTYVADGYKYENGTVTHNPAYGKVAKIGDTYYKTFEEALAAACADSSVTEIVILCDSEVTEFDTSDYYTISGKLTITAPEGENYTVTIKPIGTDTIAVKIQGDGASLTIGKNVTINSFDIVANGFWTNNEKLVIEGTLYAKSIKQWTSNNSIIVTNTGKVILGSGDGQFDFNYGNGDVTITGTGDKTVLQFKAGYTTTQGNANGNTLNLKDTYFEGGAWFNLNGSNGTINADNSLLKVSGGDAAGSLTLASNGNTINLTNGSELAVANLTIGAGNTVKLDSTSKITATKITGAGTIEIDATGMTAGDFTAIVGDLSGFTGEVAVVGNEDLSAKIVDGKIVLINNVAKIGDQGYETLQAAINAVQNGETITLLADCAEDVTVVQAPDKVITIDGNGKTMSGTITVDGKSAAYATAGLTIKNVKFDAKNITAEACINLGVSGNNNTRYTSNVTVEDCTFTGASQAKAAIKSYTGGDKKLTINICTVDDTMHSLLQATNIAGVVIDNCTVNSKNGINLNSSSDVEIKNSTVEVSGYAVRIGANGGTSGKVTLTDNTLKTDNSEGDATIVIRGTASTLVDLTMEKNVVSGNTHISGTTAGTKISADANYWDGKKEPVVSDGATAVKVNTYYADEELTQLKKNYLEGEGTAEDPYVISNIDELLVFANLVNAGDKFSGKTVVLTSDIDLGGMVWTPIKSFAGTLDGNNKTISNFSIDATAGNAGFFDVLEWATVKNLTLDNVTATVGAYRFGTLARSINQTNLDSITVKNVNVTTTASTAFVAGLFCHGTVNSNMEVNNCTVENLIVNAEKGAMIIAGITTFVQKNGTEVEGTNILENLHVKNFTVIANDTDGYCNIGGLAGQTQSVWQNPRFNNCSVTGLNVTATGTVNVGGFMCAPGSYTYAENCTVEGTIDVTGVTSANNHAGGFFGDLGWGDNVGKGDHMITNCSVDVDIITKIATAGGFVGSGTNSEGRNKNATFNYCEAKGTVTVVDGGNAVIGGFVGYADRGVYNYCSAAQEPFIGGYSSSDDVVINSYEASIGEIKYETLQEAIKAGGEVTVLRDVTLTETLTIPAGKTVVLNLNGKTISQSKACTASYEMINNKGTLTITGNGKISFNDTSAGDPTFGWGSYTIVNRGTLVIENGTIENNSQQNKDGVKHMYCAIQQAAGSVTINGGTITTAYYRSVRVNGGSLTINDGTFKGQVWVQPNQADATLTVKGGTFAPAGADGSSIFLTNEGENKKITSVEISGGIFTTKIGATNPTALAGAITGGKFTESAKNNTNAALLAEGLEFGDAAGEDGYFTLEKCLIGSGTAEDPYLINNVEELILFRDSVNAGETKYNATGVVVVLGADIDMASIDNWTPIGNWDYSFDGNFNGQGHKIMNLKMSDSTAASGEAYLGFFGITANNTIENFVIENVTISSNGQIVAAAIAYPYYTTVKDITVCGDIAIKGGNYTAGVLAYTRLCVNASNLTVSGKTGSYITGANVVGGVISDIQMNNSLVANYSNFKVSGVTITGNKAVGGISGIISGQTLTNAEVKNVTLNCSANSKGIISGSMGAPSTVTGVVYENVVGADKLFGTDYDSGEDVQAKIGDTYYTTFDAALNAAKAGDIIDLLTPYVVEKGETLTIDKDVTITYKSNVAGEDMITVRGTLNVAAGKITYVNIDSTGSNVTVSTISCEPGSVLNVTGGTIENKTVKADGSSIYSYAIDLLTNGSLGDVTATIEDGTIYSDYMAIRQFNNGTACKNTLTVKGGRIYGAKRAIQIHMDNNAAYLTISGGKIEAGDYALCLLTTSENLTVSGGEFWGSVWYSGTDGFISGGTFSEAVAKEYCAEGYIPTKNTDGTYGVEYTIIEVATKAELNAALAEAKDGYTIIFTADIDYGTDHLEITKAITLDLGGKTLTTHARNYGLALKNDGIIVKNGKLNHAGTVAAIKLWNAKEISDLEIDVTGTSGSGNAIGGIVIQQNAAGVDVIKNVKIYSTAGQGIANGIETYNCGNASEPVIGSMEKVTIDAVGTAMNISAPVGTATNCTFKGGKNGIELWIKGTYSASLTLVDCDVVGGVYAHDEFSSNPDIENNGTLSLTVDDATTGANVDDITLTIARAEKVEGVLEDVIDNAQAKLNDTYYATLAEAFAAAQDGDTVKLLKNTEVSEAITNTKKVTLDLNGKTITGIDNATGSFAIITNKGELTITGNGTITLTATNNRGWNAYSSVISNTVGGKLIVENGTIDHLGGTDMAYGIDNLTNGKGTYAETVINGGTIKSTYRAIRQFLNGVEAQNILTVNGGTIEGANKSIWMQDPSKNANTGTLTVGENAVLKGDVYLFVTKGSTEWPVEVSIAAAALADGYTVVTGNVPAQYAVALRNGAYGVYDSVAKIGEVGYASFEDAYEVAQNGQTITLLAPVVVAAGETLTLDKDVTITYTSDADAAVAMFTNRGTMIVGAGTLTFEATNPSTANAYASNTISNYGVITIKGGTIENTSNGSACYALDNYAGSTANINGGKLVAEKTTVRIFNWTDGEAAKTTLNITGGEILSKDGYGININSGNTPFVELNISGGEITTEDTDYSLAVYVVNKGSAANQTINVTGGTFNGYFALNGTTCTTMAEETVSITDGTFKGVICYGTPAYGFISGGTYTEAPDNGYLVDGYEVVYDNTTGKFGIKAISIASVNGDDYSTLAAAVEAAKNGGTIYLKRDVTLKDTLVIRAGYNVTIDLKGYTISQEKACTASYQMIENNGTLTITGNGKISFTDTGAGDPNFGWGSYTIRNEGTLVVENGTIEFTGTQAFGTHCSLAIFQYSGSTTINGGKIVNNAYRSVRLWKGDLTINGGSFEGQVWVHCVDDSAKLTISGGTFAPAKNGGDGSSVFVNNSGKKAELAVNGGTFETKIGANDADALAGAITGGKFTESAKNNTNAALLGEDLKFSGEADADGYYTLVEKLYVAMIGEVGYESLADAIAAAQDGDTVTILAGTVSEGTIKLPATLNNVTIKGNEGAILKDMTISAADGNSYSYIGLTFDGITFENSRIILTGWRNGEETIKDLTITNCTFKNLNDTTNTAPVHINKDAAEAVVNFTFTNNVIDGATGGQKSGVYAQVTGEVTFTNNTINNVSFRPYVIQITTDDGIADNFEVTGNTFSGSSVGRAQGLGSNGEGTDTVKLVVSSNIFKGITDSQQICYWNFNPETTTADLSKNYYDIDILANPTKIYYNSAAQNAEDLIEMGVYPYYADEAMTELVQAPAIMVTYPVGNPVYPDGKVEYYNDMIEAVPYTTNCPRLEGATITLLKDVSGAGMRFMENDMIFDLNGHTYTITEGTGSQGTNTSGFQIRPEVTTKVTFKNGTIEVAEGAPVVWMFNVYATDFIVEDVTIDCANMAWSYGASCYVVVSREGDNVQFAGKTEVKNFKSDVAGYAINVGGTMTIGENVNVGNGEIELDAGATLTAPEGLNVVTVDGYIVIYDNGVYRTAKVVAQIGEVGYESLAEAIAAAKAGDTIKFLADITEDVTVNKNLTIDGDNNTYTGKMTLNKVNVTIQNVNFVKGNVYKNKNTGVGGNFTIKNCTFDGQGLNDYAVNLGGTSTIVIEGVTAKDYGYGFLQVPAANTSISVKDVTVSDVNYGFKIDYSNGVTLENVKVTNASYYGIYDSNYGAKTYTIKNCEINSITLWVRDGKTNVSTFNFEGANTVGTLSTSQYAKYVLTTVDTTITAPKGATVTTNVADYKVAYENGTYILIAKDYVAQIGEVGYESLAEAIAAAQSGDTIYLLKDLNLDYEDTSPVLDSKYNVFVSVIGKDITIDFNGHEIDILNIDQDRTIIFYSEDGKLILNDSKETGSVNTKGTGLYWMFFNNGEMLIESGNYVFDGHNECDMFYANVNGMSITGGNFTQVNGSWMFNTTGNGKYAITVNGGTYNRYFIGGEDFDENPWNEVVLAEGYALSNNGNETWTVVKEADFEAVLGERDKAGYYKHLTEALKAAEKAAETGAVTVKLLANVETQLVLVPAGVTLDLNGAKLTVSYFVGVNDSNVVDRSTDKSARLVANKNFVTLAKDNEQVPVLTTDGYFFAPTIEIGEGKETDTSDPESTYLSFRPKFGSVAENLFTDEKGMSDNGLTLIVRLSWNKTETDIDGDKHVMNLSQDFKYSDSMISKVYHSKINLNRSIGFTLSATGLGNYDNMKVRVLVISDTGVEYCMKEYDIPASVNE